jgi:hypothetical protein
MSPYGHKELSKLKNMKIDVLMVPILALTMTSCLTDREITPDNTATGKVIGFSTQTAATRATVTTSLRKIGVFGYSHAGPFDDDLTSRLPDFFLNQDVADLPGDGTWTYDGVRKYWPLDGTLLSFFAYAPFEDVEDAFTLYPQTIAQVGAPKINYTVPVGIIDQIDLMYGNRKDMTYADSNNGQVGLTMDHPLTRVDFEVKLDTKEQGRPFIVEFTSLTVRNVTGTGTLDLSKPLTDADLWTTTRPATDAGWASYTMTPGGHGGLADVTFDAQNVSPAAGEVDAWDWNSLFRTGQYLMLIPQTLMAQGDGLTPAEVELDYTVTNKYSGTIDNMSVVLPLGGATIPSWEPGMGITYQITVSILDGVQIEFSIEGFINGTPWVNQNGSNPVTGTVG